MNPSLLRDLSKALSEASSLRGEEALKKLCNGALELTNSRHAFIGILNRDQGWIEVQYGAGGKFEPAIGAKLEVDVDHGIVSYVAATGKIFGTGNVLSEPIYRKLFDSTRSEIAVPIRDSHGRVSGVLNIESDREASYSEIDSMVCEIIASCIGPQIELIEQVEREDALIELGYALDKALTEEALIGDVIHVAGEVLHFQAASLFILDKQSDSFELAGSTSRLKRVEEKVRYFRGEGCTGWVCQNGKPILLQNPQNDPRWRGRYVEFPSEQISSFLCVPIFVKGKCEGALRVLRRKSSNQYFDNQFTEIDLKLMEAISAQVGNGLEHVRSLETLLRSEKMIAWGELSAKSSHMIGNRVFALKGDLNELDYLIHQEPLHQESLQSLSKSLDANVLRIEEILQDFRDFVSATKLNLALMSLNELVQDTVEELLPKRSTVNLKLDLGNNLPLVQLDPSKFKRAIGELIENSFHFFPSSKAKQTVSISSRIVLPKELETVLPSNRKGRLGLFIEDSGPGVKSDLKSKIFEPFYTSRVKGMGLGLSIVKGIIEAHGGDIYEIGVEGKGARFVILLPIPERP